MQQIKMSLICNYVHRKPVLEVTDGLPDVGAALTCRPCSSLLLLTEDVRDLGLPAHRCYSCPCWLVKEKKEEKNPLCLLRVLEADYSFYVFF